MRRNSMSYKLSNPFNHLMPRSYGNDLASHLCKCALKELEMKLFLQSATSVACIELDTANLAILAATLIVSPHKSKP